MNDTKPIKEPIDQLPPAPTQPIKRPGSVTILALGVLIITVINLSRLVLSIKYWDFLASWPGISPLYMASTGFIWVMAGMFLLWGLWKGKIWAPRLMLAVALSYALYYWLDHVFLVEHPVSGVVGASRALLPINWQFAAGVTVICLAYTAWTMGRAKVKAYFCPVEFKTVPNQAVTEDNG